MMHRHSGFFQDEGAQPSYIRIPVDERTHRSPPCRKTVT